MGRVLITFEPPDGGVPEHVAELAGGLAAHGWQAEVAGPAHATVYGRLEAAGIAVHRVPALRRGFSRPWADAAAGRDLARLARHGRFDLVHSHASKAGMLGRLAARRARLPAVYTPHCFGWVGDVSVARRAVVPAIERAAARITKAIVCVSDAEAEEAAKRRVGTAATRIRIHNGVRACDAEADERLVAILPGRPRITAVAALRPQKGMATLIDAAPEILSALPEASIAIVGNGSLLPDLQHRAAALGLDNERRFALLPFEPPTGRYLKVTDVFVLPSLWESFPISILEALACGVPQVATDVGGTAEAVTPDTGILFGAGDAEGLAHALVELGGSAERRNAMAEASRRRWQESFTAAAMVERTARLYGEVAGIPAPPAT